jgi:hypothetical protein
MRVGKFKIKTKIIFLGALGYCPKTFRNLAHAPDDVDSNEPN